ncbi:cytochrome P450 [Fomitopsis serialis]|uniref:cytochrome P450 n=1 Tax=Fomitopsis serialis TaxID=139415 RepID=UPI002007D75C|nr:cytochrome P450 [Neoantrodia serialis]KAH9921876.1 cytochrome P450 [Neoantrodia serialis]
MIVSLLAAVFLSFVLLFFKLPPGPSGIPLFGNLLQLPALRPHPKLLTWASDYGEIFHSSWAVRIADELLIRRSNNYSSRAVPHVAHELLRDGLGITFMEYGSSWRALRKALQGALGPSPAKQLRQTQEYESRVLLYDLLCHGDSSVMEDGRLDPHGEGHWYAPVRRYATSVTLFSIYGKRSNRFRDNPNLHVIYDIVDNFTRMSQPGNYLWGGRFPLLRKLPDFLAPWRVKARTLHLREKRLWEGLVEDCKADMQNGEDRSGFVNSYLNARARAGQENAPGKGFTEGEWMQDKFLAFGAGSVLEAGSDTTAMSIATFVLYMLNHPQVLRKARDEIDSVVGTERMPDFDDEERLPYFVACVKETMRHRPLAPLGMFIGIPHATMEDDFYKDYYIPKGCTVIGNIWAIHRDPERFYNPTAFMPERFYEEGRPTRWGSGPVSQDRDHYSFGWGRRFCQGSHVAQASLFITLSRLIWGIDFSAPLDPKTQRPIVPDIANEEATWSEGFVSIPYPFKVRFAARSEKHAGLIRSQFDAVQR